MKKYGYKIIALLLALIMLCGCTGPIGLYKQLRQATREKLFGLGKTTEKSETAGDKDGDKAEDLLGSLFDLDLSATEKRNTKEEKSRRRTDSIVSFSEMKYERPDLDLLMDRIADAEEALEEGKLRYSEIVELLDLVYESLDNFSTMASLANIYSSIDMTDEFHADEYAWCLEQDPVVQDLMDELYYTASSSKYGEKLEELYFWDGFRQEYDDIANSMYTPELVELMQQEAALIAEYRDVIADPTVELDGVEMSYDQACEIASGDLDEAYELYITRPIQTNYDSLVTMYYRYFDTAFSYYTKYNPIIGEIFLKMVRLRHQMAQEAGYDSYEEMQYEEDFLRSYSPADMDTLLDNIKTILVPESYGLYETINSQEGVEIDFTPELITQCISAVSGRLQGSFPQAMNFMYEYSLFDLSSGDNKSPQSFTTFLESYQAPFFIVSTDSLSTPTTAIHEFGHYVDMYQNFSPRDESIDLCEVFSQSLELLSLGALGELFTEEEMRTIGIDSADSILLTLTNCGSQVEFEKRVYALSDEELTLEAVNSIHADLIFEYNLINPESYDERQALGWIDISHFMEVPFYVPSYCTSMVAACEIYYEELENSRGIELYQNMMTYESGDIVENMDRVGLINPFDKQSMEVVIKTTEALISKYSAETLG